jgi:hypothetical protein
MDLLVLIISVIVIIFILCGTCKKENYLQKIYSHPTPEQMFYPESNLGMWYKDKGYTYLEGINFRPVISKIF